MERLNTIQKIQIKNQLERILHAPCGYCGGILEMTLVFDCNLAKDVLSELSVELTCFLKQSNDVFRNTRLNTILCISEHEYIKTLSSFSSILTGKEWAQYRPAVSPLSLDELSGMLKVFYARSKLIILISDHPVIHNVDLLKKNMQPFLYRKLLCLHTNGESSMFSITTGQIGTMLTNGQDSMSAPL